MDSALQLAPAERLFAELVLTALAAERRLRPYVGELASDPMLLRSFGTFGKWQEIPHPSRFVRERSEDTLEAVLKGVAFNEILWERATRGPLAGAWLRPSTSSIALCGGSAGR